MAGTCAATVIEYRPFRNTDPPHLAAIWRRGVGRALAQPMSSSLFDRYVLSKPYFERQGLIVAVDQGTPVGFAHAGFGPSEDGASLHFRFGVTCMVMVNPGIPHAEDVQDELLGQCEDYLVSHGAEALYGGAVYPLNPFYLGLYGGSELPGILDSDAGCQRVFQRAGYREVDRTRVLHLDLTTFRAVVDRKQLLVRRLTQVHSALNPPAESWWEACTTGPFETMRFSLVARADGACLATATFRDMEPLSTAWGVHAMGLTQLEVPQSQRRKGYGSFLLGEAMRHLQSLGVSLLEAQTMARNTGALAFYERLGFRVVDSGAVYRRDAPRR